MKYWWGIWPYGYMSSSVPTQAYGEWTDKVAVSEAENDPFTLGEIGLLKLLYDELVYNIFMKAGFEVKKDLRMAWETSLVKIVRDKEWM